MSLFAKITSRLLFAFAGVMVLLVFRPGFRGHHTATRRLPRPVLIEGQRMFMEANKFLGGKSTSIARGKGPEASKLAATFAELFLSARNAAFTGAKATEGRPTAMVTYCAQQPGSVLFLVRVPSFRHFKKGVRRHLLFIAWDVANKVLADARLDAARVAVGMRGEVFYGGAVTGAQDREPAIEQGYSIGEERFYPFFAELEAQDVRTSVQAMQNPDRALKTSTTSQ